MLALFLAVVIIAIVLGLIGAVVHGLIWLLVIGIIVFVLNFLFHGRRLRNRRGR
jgi:hypothetical protein